MDLQADTPPDILNDAIDWRVADGFVPYEAAVATMEARVAAIHAGSEGELVWLVEHPPLYTAGTSANAADLIDPKRLPVFKAGRGGQYTYHGPGQRVAYVMLDLTKRGRDVGCHVWQLEEWMIRVLARFGVTGERRAGRVGVWVEHGGHEDKIGAIGVRVRHWVTYHGLALNVAPDLGNYAGIVPCGISGHGVTSLAALGVKATMADVDAALRTTFDDVFGRAGVPELMTPTATLAAELAARVLGRTPCSVERFKTGARHHVFDLYFESGALVVVRIGESSAHAEMAGAVHLSRLLRPLGVPLPLLLAHDLDTVFPWMMLERLEGSDLGAIAPHMSAQQLDRLAAEVARAQAITATTGSAGRFGYAARAEDAPYAAWSRVLEDNLARSRRRITAAGLFDPSLVAIVEDRVDAMRRALDAVAAVPFLHDTTIKNVIVTAEGDFSGIVDVDDLCFGDPRYPAALTLAAMLAYGGPQRYVAMWLQHAGQRDDTIFRLYVTLFLLDLMSEHGHTFNGNARASTAENRHALLATFDTVFKAMSEPM